MTYYEYRDVPANCMNNLMMRHQDFQLQLPVNIPEKLQQFISSLPFNRTEVPIIFKTYKELMPVETKITLMNVSENKQSIQLSYMLNVNSLDIMSLNEHLLFFTIDYDLQQNSFDLRINMSISGDQKFKPVIEPIFVGAELEGALLNAQVVSPPHYNEQTKNVSWCWRFAGEENMAELSQRLLKSFIYYTYYQNDFYKLLRSYTEIAKTPEQYGHIIQCVKDFFDQNKHVRVTIGRPDLPVTEWIKLDSLKATLPPELLPAAEAQHLFDKPEHVKKLIQAQKSIGEDLKALRESDGQTISKGPGSLV